MYRDTGAADEFETLYSIPTLTVRRFRMKKVESLDNLETGATESIIALSNGSAELRERRNSLNFRLDPHDACYLPPGDSFSLQKRSEACEIIWATAPATVGFDPYLRRYADCKHVEVGSNANASRRLNTTMVSRFEKSERLRIGYTEADRGNWTSFPPHRHDGIPEVYVFTGMGRGFGLQMVWDEKGERTYVVKEGDAVGFDEGYHPNVGDPTTGLKFFWVLSCGSDRRN
jgi:5-deoxy-glucuronate isomerase